MDRFLKGSKRKERRKRKTTVRKRERRKKRKSPPEKSTCSNQIGFTRSKYLLNISVTFTTAFVLVGVAKYSSCSV